MANIFRDEFTEGSDTVLDSHTPDTGTGWTQLITSGGGEISVIASSDTLLATGGGLSDSVLYTADATYNTADYAVGIRMVVDESSDDYHILAARIQDSNNMYAVQMNGSDVELWKRVSGTWTQLGSTYTGNDPDIIQDDTVVVLVCDGTTISVYVGGIQAISVTDSAHSSAGKGGYGMGSIISSGADMADQEADYFFITELMSSDATETLRPDGDGDVTQLTPSTGSNYQNVDESSADDDTTYNKTPSGGFGTRYDLYTLDNSGMGASQEAEYIDVTVRSRRVNASAGENHSCVIKSDSVEQLVNQRIDPGATYSEDTWRFYAAPNGKAFTKALIDALQAGGMAASNNLGDDDIRITQVFVTVNYGDPPGGAAAPTFVPRMMSF